MFNKFLATAAALTALTGTTQAQQIGGSLGVSYLKHENISGTQYNAATEYSLNQNFGLSASLSGYNISNQNNTFNDLTLHGIYHISSSASAGVFVNRTKSHVGTITSYGAEFGGEAPWGGTLEAHLGYGDNGQNNLLYFGAQSEHRFENSFALFGKSSYATVDNGETLNSSAAGVSYYFESGPKVFAKLGQISSQPNNTTIFFGLGAEVTLGNDRGVTFGSRNYVDAAYGF